MRIFSLLVVLTVSISFISGCVLSGGSCEYKSYNGVLTIEEVRDDSGEKERDYLVSYKFAPENPDSNASRDTGRASIARLTKEQIAKKDVKPGRQFRTSAGYIVSGSCPPGPNADDFENWR